MDNPRIRLPKVIKRNEPFEVKTLISHKMESGQRLDEENGQPIPRNIIRKFVCLLDGLEVFRVRLYPGVAENPFLTFFLQVERSGKLTLIWEDDHGETIELQRTIEVALP